MDSNLNNNNGIASIFLTFILGLFSWAVTPEGVSLIIKVLTGLGATGVSIFGIRNYIFSIREKKLRIKKLLEDNEDGY